MKHNRKQLLLSLFFLTSSLFCYKGLEAYTYTVKNDSVSGPNHVKLHMACATNPLETTLSGLGATATLSGPGGCCLSSVEVNGKTAGSTFFGASCGSKDIKLVASSGIEGGIAATW